MLILLILSHFFIILICQSKIKLVFNTDLICFTHTEIVLNIALYENNFNIKPVKMHQNNNSCMSLKKTYTKKREKDLIGSYR